MKITAHEARQIVDCASQVDCKRFYAFIKNQAHKGESCARFSLTDREKKLVDKIMADLRFQGFKTKIESGYDQCDDVSWYYLDVSW